VALQSFIRKLESAWNKEQHTWSLMNVLCFSRYFIWAVWPRDQHYWRDRPIPLIQHLHFTRFGALWHARKLRRENPEATFYVRRCEISKEQRTAIGNLGFGVNPWRETQS